MLQVAEQWQKLQIDDPAKAREARQQCLPANGRKDWNGLLLVVSQWTRKTEVAMRHRLREVDWRKFKHAHQKLGYKKAQVKKKWENATGAEAFKKGMARRCGKKIFVWIDKGRECDETDIISLAQSGGAEENWVSAEQHKKMLRGRHGMELSDQAKRETFGGVLLLTTAYLVLFFYCINFTCVGYLELIVLALFWTC